MKSILIGNEKVRITREAEHIRDSKQCETCKKHYKDGNLACNNVLLFRGKYYETECANYDPNYKKLAHPGGQYDFLFGKAGKEWDRKLKKRCRNIKLGGTNRRW